jgi:LuxR family transcriptional regulator, maltose regulon positive regulatory protein
VPDLHVRASAWFAARGLVLDAIRHALAADDFDRAAYLMEEALPEMRRTRQDGLLMMWMRSLPEPSVRRSPVLSIVSGWSLMMSGDLDGVESRLDDAEAALIAGTQDPDLAATWADTEDLRTAPATVSVYRAAVAQARGDVAGTVRHARHVLDLARPEDHFLRGAGAGYLGLHQARRDHPGSGGAPRPRTRTPLSLPVSHRHSHHVVTRCHPVAS